MKRHWYTVKVEYCRNNRTLFSMTKQLGCARQKDITDERQVKRMFQRYLFTPAAKPLLCNGALQLTVIAYLGRFDAGGPTLWDVLAERFGELFMPWLIHIKDRA